MPCALGMEVPALLLALDHLGRDVLPGNIGEVVAEARAPDRHHVGDERIEEPLLLVAAAGLRVVVAELAELLARLDAELDAPVPQHLAGLAVVDLRVHVQGGEERVEGRGGRVHQERLVEALVLDEAPLAADVLVALVDLGSLREAGALLVDGLGGEEPRHLRPQRGEAHRAVVLEERMEGVVADPGLVPEDVLAQVPDLLQDLADVVDRAVVGRELDAREPEGALRLVPLRVLHQRVRPDLLPEPVLVPGVPVDGADHAEGVSRGGEEDRDRPGLDERALVDGLVVVPVEQDQVPSPQHRVRDHFVRAAGAVQHEVGLVGPEHLRGVALRLRGGALVDQQVAEVHVGIAEIVAEDPLPEVLEEELAGGGLPVELTALVTRAVEGNVGLGVVGHEPRRRTGAAGSSRSR